MIDRPETTGRPLWARPDLFRQAPGPGWGYLHRSQGDVAVENLAALQEAVRGDEQEMIALVWTPDSPFMEVPEALSLLEPALMASRAVSTERDLAEKNHHLRTGVLLFFAFVAYMGWEIFRSMPGGGFVAVFVTLLSSGGPVLGLLLFVMFFLLPWYEVRKRWKEVHAWTAETMREAADLARFEMWLSTQKIVATKVLLGLIAIAGVVQIISGRPLAAALQRGGGDDARWTLMTAPFLHGNMIHFVMNALGLLYLGRRIEALARWPQVPIVFLFSAWIGGELSMATGKGLALGASGGLMGMLGFLLVFETRHAKLVPRSSRRRLLAALIGTALIGLVGIQFIDNSAHAGGVIAGMLYAFIVFPRSESAMRPKPTMTDQVVALLCYLLMLFGVWLACMKMMGR